MYDLNKHSSIYSLGNSNTFLSSADFVVKIYFFKKSSMDPIRVVKGLFPDQDRGSVGTDPDSICLQCYQQTTTLFKVYSPFRSRLMNVFRIHNIYCFHVLRLGFH